MATTMMEHISSKAHLGRALEYIEDTEKTEDYKYVAGINCPGSAAGAYEAFWATKEIFGKDLTERVDGRKNRLAYHFVFSFVPGEVSKEEAWEIIQKISNTLIGEEYEALCCMHTDRAHLHGHLIFNSVSRIDGRKYHYGNGDWKKQIQPLVNKICEEYGLSTINLGLEASASLDRAEWEALKQKQPNTSDALRMAINKAITVSKGYQDFLRILSDAGFQCMDGKYLSLKNPDWGMERARRSYQLGKEYTKERIQERILAKDAVPETGSNRAKPEAQMPENEWEELQKRNLLFSPGKPVKRVTFRSVTYRRETIYIFGQYSRYFRQYWRSWKLWQDLRVRPLLPKKRRSPVVLKDYQKMQNRVRVLIRYGIKTDKDLDRAVEQLKSKSKELKQLEKRLMEIQHNPEAQEGIAVCRQELHGIRSSLRVLQSIKTDTSGQKVYESVQKRTKTNENVQKRIKTYRNVQKRTNGGNTGSYQVPAEKRHL